MSENPKATGKGSARPPLTLLQVLAIIGLVAGLLIMLDFNRRQAEAQRLEADRNQLATEVAVLDYQHSRPGNPGGVCDHGRGCRAVGA